MPTSTAEFVKRTTIVVLIALVPVLVWYLFDVILMAMGALILAALLNLGAEPFVRGLGLPRSVGLILSALVIVVVIGGAGYLFGTRIGVEFQDVFQRAAEAQKSLTSGLKNSELGRLILSHTQVGNVSIAEVLGKLFTVSTGLIEAIVVSVVAGLYITAQPDIYRTGLVDLFTPRSHPRARETIDAVANALRLWLLGQLIQMVIIGVLSTVAVWLIGLPAPLALGLIAGVAEFIPYLGPILAAIPAALVAATIGIHTLVWTLVAYLAIHQIEGNLVVPIVQKRMLYIPPAIILLGIVSISFLFGAVALVFAAPIVVVLYVLIKKLYVRETLGETTSIPGEGKS